MAGIGNEEFDFFADKAAIQLLPGIHLELHPHPRIVIDESSYRLRDQLRGRRRAAAETHPPGLQSVELADFVGQVVRAMHQAAGVFQHQQALPGRLQVLAGAVHQAAADVVLQGLDAAAEGGLRQVHRGGGGNEAAVLGQGDEVAELAKVDMHFLHGKIRWNAIAAWASAPYKGNCLSLKRININIYIPYLNM
ncbi:hypothetical protein D9M70_557510 [compost metagenome]